MTDNVSDSIENAESRAQQGGERDMDNSPGSQLQRGREAAGVSREELSRRLCMTTDKLELLERDEYDRLPSALYVRGYIRNACKELGMDPAPVLDAFSGYAAAEEESRAIVEHVRRGPVIDNRPRRNLGGLALLPLLLVGGIFWWLNGRDLTPPVLTPPPADSAAEEIAAPAGEAPAESAQFATAQEVAPDPPSGTGEPGAADPAVAADESPAAEPVGEQAATGPATGAETTEEPVSEPAYDPPAEAAADHSLELSFSEESWVEVRDAGGAVLLAKLQPAGSEVDLEGEAPFEVMLGNARGTRVRFDGERVDSGPVGNRRTRRLMVGD